MSRLTFRESAGDVCWQRQLRDKYLSEGIPRVPHLDLKRARIRPISRKAAQQIILKYEWLGTMGNTSHHFGLFFGPFCAGVTCVTDNTGVFNPNTFKTFGLQRQELAVLARGACVHWAPPGANSKLVSWTCRLMKQSTDCKLMLGYADSDAGEIGTIYQASNWAYIGLSGGGLQWVSPRGVLRHDRLASHLVDTHGGVRSKWTASLLKAGWKRQPVNPKHRYACVLDRADEALCSRIERMRKSYPKRADG